MFHATTIVAVKKNGIVAMAGDGQVTFGDKTVMKHGAKKLRRLYNGQVIAGFAGSVADALSLFDMFEKKLEEYYGDLIRAAVEMAKEWRTDRVLRKLEALLLVSNKDNLLIISGTGEIIEPDDDIAAIGSGGAYALAAARALVNNTNLPADIVVKEALLTAASICVFTNDNITVEQLKGGR
ncbi:ATP-dependent protease subunit HslV [Metallumcola ferriviriculae]|uniref:ATP-dependent protease subunit HslV n=1 Tax=Metallumcola ferriviriculae TaxID=3039180 RepID=A0AAU0USJ6_9FIRM|nr:ATP-dependent protease subunit HslV [Desulfitibacteraceae bacterium MK1]